MVMKKKVESLVELMKLWWLLLVLVRRSGGRRSESLAGVVVAGDAVEVVEVKEVLEVRVLVKRRKRKMK